MDAIKRANFASKQIRAGPAPLASFEDLPSDELESPEDLIETPIYQISALDNQSGSEAQLTTPDSLTISSQSTPRIECDFDSNFTLTPGDAYEGQTSSELRTISLSSLSKESTLNVNPKKGSAISLGTIDTSEPEYSQRKSSWTDIFKSHNQNSVKSSSVSSHLDCTAEKAFRKKAKNDITNKDQTDSKAKEKGKFLSFFKKKSSRSANSPLSPDDVISETANVYELEEVKITNGNVHKGKENELPVNLEPTFNEGQNDLGRIIIEKNKIPDERKINRKIINIYEKSDEKEYNISSQNDSNQLDKLTKTENVQAIIHNIDHESSESELVFEEKETVSELEKKEDDYEAETLLTPDMSEMEDDQLIELQPVTYEISKQIMIPSRQQRLEVTTKPIDRPRSTTPINTASLEAFIHSASPTSLTNVEKIKLSLPGEQFLGRVKSPKKSSAKSWSDFCEKGLSPRMHNRNTKDDNEDLFSPFDGANFSAQNMPLTDSNWAAFETDFKKSESNNRFSDNFNSVKDFDTASNEQKPQLLTDPYQAFETDFILCSCDCHKQSLVESKQTSVTTPNSESAKIICSCDCLLRNSESFKSDLSRQDTCDVANALESIVLK